MKPISLAISCLAAILLAGLAPALAQVRIDGTYMERLKRAEAAVPALPADPASRARNADSTRAVVAASSPLQTLGTIRSMVGDTEGAIATFDLIGKARTRSDAEIGQMRLVEGASAEDAIKAIVDAARSKRVVLLNEAHHVTMHRAFAQKLAAELRKIGYTYLACEAFGRIDGPVLRRGFVDRSTGLYLADPVFAGFINSATADGWKLISYDHQDNPPAERMARLKQRELSQATNLVNRIFANDKDAKVFIYVGYGHLNKSPDPANEDLLVMMGEHLRQMTKLDMLHVEQTNFYAHPDPADEMPLYPLLLQKFPSTAPIVLTAKDGSHPILMGMDGRIDMQVIFPRYSVQDGRPAWLQTLAGRQPHDVPAGLLPAAGRRLILAYRAADGEGAVPADIVMVEAGKPVPKLMLPGGEFRYAFED